MMTVENDAGIHSVTVGARARSKSSAPRRAFARLLLTGLLATGLVGVASAHPERQVPSGTYAPMDLPHLHAVYEHLMATVSPEQAASMAAIGKAAHADLQALNQQALAAHRRKVDLLLQDRLDRVALDRARADEIEAADRLAQRIDGLLLNLAELMTPEQRAQLRNHVDGHEG
jgi:Spy/CpxP family protein refolding chaperone